MLNCEQATRLMSERQDGETLSLSKKASLFIHEVICSGCRQFDKQSKQISNLIRKKEQK